MVDRIHSKYGGVWRRNDKNQFPANLFFTILPLFFIIILIFADDIRLKVISFIFILISIPVVILAWMFYVYYKNMWVKTLYFNNEIVIRTIENALRKEKIPYTKIGGAGEKTPPIIVLAEIFELHNIRLKIRIYKDTGVGCAIDLGPINHENELQINNLMNIIDKAFFPSIL